MTKEQVRQRRQRLRSTKLWLFKEREPAWTCCFYENTQQKCGWRTSRVDIYLKRVLAPLSTVYQILPVMEGAHGHGDAESQARHRNWTSWFPEEDLRIWIFFFKPDSGKPWSGTGGMHQNSLSKRKL